MRHKKTIAISIPTGIAASIGGFAGDGGKIARMFSKYFNVLTHPNVVNGGILSAVNDNILYVEGFAFDEFFKGNISINPLGEFEQNKIGVIFDKSIPSDILAVHINTISAAKEVLGFDIPYYEITEDAVGVEFYVKNNISTGVVQNEKTLLKAAKKLIHKGANALAVVCYFGDDADDMEYENGVGVDPIGGIEAVISHYLTKELMIPIAHAPAFFDIDISRKISNPKVASENISSTYLPCVLYGLNKAPVLDFSKKTGIKNKDIEALIVPYKALGGIAPIACIENKIKIMPVKNETKGQFGCDEAGLNDIMEYESYNDCLTALRELI